MKPALSVIVPCFNEEGNVLHFPERLFPALDELKIPYEILAIDDGSGDRTAEILQSLQREFPPLRVLRHKENRGLGRSIRYGFLEAKAPFCVVIDADLSFQPEQIAELVSVQREADVDCVAGSPILGGYAEEVPWIRRAPSRLVNRLYQWLFISRISAYTSIFRLYRREAIQALPLSSDGFEINAEILILLLRGGRRVEEIPVRLSTRRWGRSKMRSWRELLRHLRLIRRLRGPA